MKARWHAIAPSLTFTLRLRSLSVSLPRSYNVGHCFHHDAQSEETMAWNKITWALGYIGAR